MQCYLCGKLIKSKIGQHVVAKHGITYKEYYDTYIKTSEDICPICGKQNRWYRNHYKQCCSQECAAKLRHQKQNHDLAVKQFEQENNCINIVTLRETYGQGWYKAKIIDNYICHPIHSKMFFVYNEDISKIEIYSKQHLAGKSNKEKELVKYLRQLNISIIENSKKVIAPYELDIYIPDLKLAIEYNGSWYHSIEYGTSKEYHLQKSLLCREKGIRLIHVYEFENFEVQKQLLYDLIIQKQDNYNPLDFNKNNFIESIPEPKLIHITERGYHIYGAGLLY